MDYAEVEAMKFLEKESLRSKVGRGKSCCDLRSLDSWKSRAEKEIKSRKNYE